MERGGRRGGEGREEEIEGSIPFVILRFINVTAGSGVNGQALLQERNSTHRLTTVRFCKVWHD